MITNYHTHTARCMHASGEDEEYIEKAIAESFTTLGFSDHAPTIYPEPYESYYKMPPSQAADYFRSLCSLREKYADKIEIHIGYETEFLPDTWEASLNFWKKSPSPEYLILGQHYTDFEIRDRVFGDRSYCKRYHENPEVSSHKRLTRYVDGVIHALSSDCFSCLAHPDIITSFAEPDFYLAEMQRLIDGAKRYGVPLEFNLLGFNDGRLYPRREFWELVAQNGGSAVLGCDAHSPDELANREGVSRAEDFLNGLGVKILKKIELRKPF